MVHLLPIEEVAQLQGFPVHAKLVLPWGGGNSLQEGGEIEQHQLGLHDNVRKLLSFQLKGLGGSWKYLDTNIQIS